MVDHIQLQFIHICLSLVMYPSLVMFMGLLDNEAMLGEQGDITDIPSAYCFYGLFRNSNGITSVSDDFLPASTLTEGCYAYMFQGCTSLKSAPKLSATTLADYCYTYMFFNCTLLNSIKIDYTGNYSGVYFNNWVSGVARSGTFYYNGSQTPQDFQLPSGWNKY